MGKITTLFSFAILFQIGLIVWAKVPQEPAGARRPNIVLIMADDLGYSDVGCFGGEIDTPNINRLAAEGLRFSQFYNCAVCGTTRASLMTGLYPQQVGVRTWNGIRNDRCLNLGEALQEAGYRTMMVGKWTDTQSPNFKGFDRSFGSLANKGPTNYFKMNRTDDHFLDKDVYIMPTCLDLAGGSYPKNYRGRDILPVEGKSLVPIFKGQQRPEHTALFWELNGHRAVRSGEWKIVGQEKQAWELYNLEIDRGEINDLADRRPDIVNRLSVMYQEWYQRCNEGL